MKNASHLAYCKFDINVHQSFLIIFGRNVTEKIKESIDTHTQQYLFYSSGNFLHTEYLSILTRNSLMLTSTIFFNYLTG